MPLMPDREALHNDKLTIPRDVGHDVTNVLPERETVIRGRRFSDDHIRQMLETHLAFTSK